MEIEAYRWYTNEDGSERVLVVAIKEYYLALSEEDEPKEKRFIVEYTRNVEISGSTVDVKGGTSETSENGFRERFPHAKEAVEF